MTATPNPGFSVDTWTGCASTTNTCEVNLTAATTVAVTFKSQPITPVKVTLTTATPANGKVTSVPTGIDCRTTCQANFDAGTKVTLTATPDSGFSVDTWIGCTSTTNTCEVNLTTATIVYVTFKSQLDNSSSSAEGKCFEGSNAIFKNLICRIADPLSPIPIDEVDIYGKLFTVDASIVGGISKAGSNFIRESMVTLRDRIEVAGSIKVASKHIGKRADLFVMGEHISTIYPSGSAYYMLDGCSTCVRAFPSDSKDILVLLRALNPLTTVILPPYQVVDMYAGNFVYAGPLKIYFGYRINQPGDPDNGAIVHNPLPIDVDIKQ